MNNSVPKYDVISNRLLRSIESDVGRRILVLSLTILIGLIIGWMILEFPLSQVLAFVVGVVFLAFSVWKIELPFYLCLFLLLVLVRAPSGEGSIFAFLKIRNYPGIPSFTEMALGLLVVSFIIRLFLNKKKMLFSPLNLVTLVFTVLLVISFLVGFKNDVNMVLLKEDFKKFLAPVGFLICSINILDNEEKIRSLVKFVFIVILVKSCLGSIYYLKGSGILYGDSQVVFLESSDQLLLVTLIVVLFSLIIHKRIKGEKWIYTLLALGSALFSVVFSYRRSAWLGLVVSLGLLFLLVPGNKKIKILGIGVCGILILALLVSFSNLVGTLPSREFLQDRFLSIGDLEQSSNVSRFKEWAVTLEDIMKNPILGLGLGSTHQEVPEFPTLNPHTVHNAFLMVWMKMGLFALVLFLWCLVRYFISGVSSAKAREDYALKPLLIGLVSSFGFWIISFNIAATWFSYRETCLMALVSSVVLVIPIIRNVKADESC